ncbi:MAG: hypothetical protein A3C58_03850 [Candidatus Staskawiczbacteria bacterium RIFCSPHIGHO2_02_FULL_34_10]|uniref:Four helix bundle protein n=1 Tax=Candidatus Staskawiczbacteria bacterium RIFCSPHIGHO2_02_FULL_34_10 TaxID=1802205 RepID=A0A1G2HXV4_9BACT|nr:MAG: hypothetical protein A3C58_03850 [Candidatus Staskawiczbacteria bacterium RIFCSPHIGHO2_02_FULL_34_10]
MKFNSVEDLEVYRRLFNLVIEIHNLTLMFPKFKTFELGSQLRRSSNSALANLAEGLNNKHTNIYLEGISGAQGEIRETARHLRIVFKKKYINQEKLDYFLKEYDVCGRMLTNLEKSLKS